MTDGFWAVDSEWRITFLNEVAKRAIKKFGITKTPERLLGKKFWDIFPDSVDSIFFKEYNRAMQSQKTVTFESYYPPLNAWFESHAYPNGGGLSIYFREITAKKKMAEELLDSELRYRTLSESLSDGILTLSQSGKIIYANAASETIFGYSVSEMIGKPFTLLLPESLRENYHRNLDEYLQTGIRPFDWERAEVPGICKNGGLVSLEMTIREVSEQNKIIFIAVLRNLSKHKETAQSHKILVSLH